MRKLQFDFLTQFKSIRFIYKVQDGHLNFILSDKSLEPEKKVKILKELLPKYIQFNNDSSFYGSVHGSVQKDF